MSEADAQAPLRRGWTTGACASGAARAAFEALLTGVFPDPVPVALPKGLRPAFALAKSDLGPAEATAGLEAGAARLIAMPPRRPCSPSPPVSPPAAERSWLT